MAPRPVSVVHARSEAAVARLQAGADVTIEKLMPLASAPSGAGPPGRILIVDDHGPNRRLLRRMLVGDDHELVEADTGERALQMALDAEPDVILLDVMMRGMDGFSVCEALKQDPRTRLIPVVLVTALTDRDDRLRGIRAGADDFLTKPVDPHQLTARVQSLIRLKRFTDELDSAEAVIVSLALTIEARDGATEGHCERLARYATAVGQAIGLAEEDLWALTRGGYLHDIGKVGIPDSVLLKPGPLTASEFEIMKTHTVVGDRLCGELRALRRVRPIVRHHHERLDGSGYPDGLVGSRVPLLAQIMGIVDVYDALVSVRPYKRAYSHLEAVEVLEREVMCGWRDGNLVQVFTRVVHERPAAEPSHRVGVVE